MTTKFSDFIKEIEVEAQQESEEAVEDLKDLRDHYKNLVAKLTSNG